MIIDEIKQFSKKELSGKAKAELKEILEKVDFCNKSEVEETVAELFNLDADVLYEFILTLDEEKSSVIADIIDCKKADKAYHIFVAAIALYKADNVDKARDVMERFISANICEKTNKKIYKGLTRALSHNGADVLTKECAAWNERNINKFRKLWVEAAEYLKNEKFSGCAAVWFANNNIRPTQAELASLSVKAKAEPATEAAMEEAKAIDKLTTEELIKELANRLQEAEGAKNDFRELEASNAALKKEIAELKQKITHEEEKNRELASKKSELERKTSELEDKISGLNKALDESRKETEKFRKMLDNVESAYGQAGQTEVEALTFKIKSRLAAEHEQYLEIKAKEPDLDYYDILINMLDEIYKVLRKNGITF